MVRPGFSATLVVALLVLATQAHAAVTVRIDRTAVPITDSIRVVFRVEGQASGQPDFAPLEQDFEVLGTAQSTSVNIVNGRMEQTAAWTVDLLARRTGTLTLPPIDFGNGETSPARTITVTAARADPGGADSEVFLEVEAMPATPYVQSLLRYTVRVFRSVATSDASLSEPRIGTGDALIERLGEDVAYETDRGGVRYSVVERRYAIFPQASGPLVVDPLRFEARIGRRASIFDRFDNSRIVRVGSEAMEIEVLPIPAEFTGQEWLPAESLQLTEAWPGDGAPWRAGEPLTRTLTLRARGLTASQLPEIEMPVPDGLKQYPDQPQLDSRVADQTMVAMRRETVALIPSQPGEYTLPPVEIPWWNTERGQMEVATVPARKVRVLPAAGAPAQPAAPALDPLAQATPASAVAPVPGGDVARWQWVSAALGLGWLATLAAWGWRSRRSSISEPARERRPRPVKPGASLAALERACRDDDAEAAHQALLQWAAAHWPGSPVRSLGELAARLDGPVQAELHRLSRQRYSAGREPWNGAALWAAFRTREERQARRETTRDAPLEPLYRS